jgi:hypothetical protein
VDGLTEGRTDMTKIIVAFLKSSNAPKNDLEILVVRDRSDLLGVRGRLGGARWRSG